MHNLTLIIPWILAAVIGANDRPSYDYVSVSDNPRMNSNQTRIHINMKSGLISYSGLLSRYSICDKLSAMVCISSDVMTFAVPKVNDLAGKEWNHAGNEFRVLDAIEVEMLGEKYNIYRIASYEDDNVRWLFYYSCSEGLIMIGEAMSPDYFHFSSYVSQTRPGFGAWCR